MDEGLEESIASVIWSTPRLLGDVPELKTITEQFTLKYGKEFAQGCRNDELDNVNEKLMNKLKVQPPPKSLIEHYLVEISKAYSVPFEPDPCAMESDVLAAEGTLIDFGGNSFDKKVPLQPAAAARLPEPLPSYNPQMPPSQPFNYPAPVVSITNY